MKKTIENKKIAMKKIKNIRMRSPWIERLNKKRPINVIEKNKKTTVTIIGAGISGVTTAYYFLKDTTATVCLLEANKLAHGATGHNAGQIASYFEHGFEEIVKEYGLKKAIDGQRAIVESWDLLDHIIHEADIVTKPESFAGFAGCSRIEQVLTHLKRSYLRAKQNLRMSFAYIVDDKTIRQQIPKKYDGLYAFVSKENILKKLETTKTEYIAALTVRKGVMNSAKFCEELVSYLQKTYPSRFSFFEKSKVETINYKKNSVEVMCNSKKLISQKVILCTNGFQTLEFKQDMLQKRFIDLQKGLVGSMSGYTTKKTKDSTAITYFPKDFTRGGTYFYLTRRTHTKTSSLVCIGGPDKELQSEQYNASNVYLPTSPQICKEFLIANHKYTPHTVSFNYNWEGLMGFTITKVRCVGPDPKYPNIVYNLGCNGVGILTAIFGSKRLSLLHKGIHLPPSLFDAQLAFKKLEKEQNKEKIKMLIKKIQ